MNIPIKNQFIRYMRTDTELRILDEIGYEDDDSLDDEDVSYPVIFTRVTE